MNQLCKCRSGIIAQCNIDLAICSRSRKEQTLGEPDVIVACVTRLAT